MLSADLYTTTKNKSLLLFLANNVEQITERVAVNIHAVESTQQKEFKKYHNLQELPALHARNNAYYGVEIIDFFEQLCKPPQEDASQSLQDHMLREAMSKDDNPSAGDEDFTQGNDYQKKMSKFSSRTRESTATPEPARRNNANTQQAAPGGGDNYSIDTTDGDEILNRYYEDFQ